MKKYFPYSIVYILILGLFSCRSIYTPTTPNVPLFQNRNEFQFESSIFTNGINAKIAYSPIKHIGVLLNGQSSYSGQYEKPQYHYYSDGAIGYYLNINKNHVGEIYFGYGSGESNFGDPFNGSEYELTIAKGYYDKLYSQINWGFLSKKGNVFGASVRIADVRYTYIHTPNFGWLNGNTYSHFSAEPYFYFKLKMTKYLSIVNYFGLTLITGNHKTIRTNLLNCGTGIRLNIGQKIEK